MAKSYHPPATLKAALAIPKTLFEQNAGNPWFRLRLAEALKLKPEARAFRQLVTASSQYGLTSGSYSAEKITLESRGDRIVSGDLDAVYEALFSVELFENFYEHFSGGGTRGLPSEPASRDFLKGEFGVPNKQLDKILGTVLTNARDWHLIQEISGGERFVSRELASQTAAQADALGSFRPLVAPPEPVGPISEERKPISDSRVRLAPGLQLNIEIHIGPDTSEDKIEAIFRNMRKYLLPNVPND